MLEGVFLSAVVPRLRSLTEGRVCRRAGVVVRHGLTLVFPHGSLFLVARPDAPGIWWSREEHEMAEPASPAWRDHLEGAGVTDVRQQGADRVIVLEMESADPYSTGGVRLVFEATGRNANLVLVRDSDDRVLAVDRRVDSDRSRYRTLVPGSRYVPPPPSGLPPEQWCGSRELREALASNPGPADVYRRLEGVGPCTAAAILTEAESSERTVFEVVCELAGRLEAGDFRPWSGPDGPLPVPLGPGEPLEEPLAPRRDPGRRTVRRCALDDYLRALRREAAGLRRKLERLKGAEAEMTSPEEYRHWGDLLLANSARIEKGASSVTLDDWEGGETTVPLSRARGPVSNAQRYFRKARRCAREERSLRKAGRKAAERLEELERLTEEAGELGRRELERRLARRRSSPDRGRGGPLEYRLADGWRCFVGRSAKDNDRVTFGLGRRGDIWLHARGLAGAHVLIKREGRGENPSRQVLMQAASIAANHSRASGSSIVPVDWTEVQHVRRMGGGGPGQVTYRREKTLYPDLSDPATERFLERIGDA